MWKTLHLRARRRGTTISELAREAVREKYGSATADRREAMQSFVGIWKDRPGVRRMEDSTAYVRKLRKGSSKYGLKVNAAE